MIIRVKNLKLQTIIGIHEWERTRPQPVVINMEIELDAQEAVETDRIEDTVDYEKVTDAIVQDVESTSFFLIETLVHRIMDLVMINPKVQKASVEIQKPDAIRLADSVSVEYATNRALWSEKQKQKETVNQNR